MPPHIRVSSETRAAINPKEMDEQLQRLRDRLGVAPPTADARAGQLSGPLRFQSTRVVSGSFLYGRGDSVLDAACDLLAPDLRPVPPQPNCPQSMKIYDQHRLLAAEYIRVTAEKSELLRYKQELTEKLMQEESRVLTPEQAIEYTQLQTEKEALLKFREKLAEQLKLIEAAQAQNAGSAHSSNSSSEGWVMVNNNASNNNT